jgi:hypothetical protein
MNKISSSAQPYSNAASSAKLYPELNLMEKKLCDGIRYQGHFHLLIIKIVYLHRYKKTFKEQKQTYKGTKNTRKKNKLSRLCALCVFTFAFFVVKFYKMQKTI